jgi:mono/diheme cytochrome c family protein
MNQEQRDFQPTLLLSSPQVMRMIVEREVAAEMIRLLFGIVVGILLLPVAAWAWFTYGHPPVAVADAALPFERMITGAPLHARIDLELPKTVPVEVNEATFVAGAHIYREQCAFCHGVYGNPSKVGPHMFPDAPPLWEKHPDGNVVGVSDDPPGETYWKVSNGIRLTGMPAYKQVLSETEMWQVSVLLANADKPLPPAALDLLKQPLNFNPPAAQPAAGKPPVTELFK